MPAMPALWPLMVQYLLDDVRLNADIGHARGAGAPQIMRFPFRYLPG
jgi:hypothetical protein